MGDSHNKKRFHRPDGILPGGFFAHDDFRVPSYGYIDQQPDMGLQPHFGSRMANNQVQDDQFLQRGFYTSGPSQLHGAMAPSTQSRHVFENLDFGYQPDMQQAFGLQVPDMTLAQGGQVGSHMSGHYGNLPIQYGPHQDYQNPYTYQTGMENQKRDDDNESVISSATTDCDSNCDLADPCTDEDCAGREDACTDRQCPEKDCPDTNCPEKMPSEVVVAAATLAAFGGIEPPQQQQNHIMSQQGPHAHGFPASQQAYCDGTLGLDASFNPFNIVKHIGTAHDGLASSHCSGPCPIEDPQIFQYFQHCPFPNTFDFNPNDFDLNNPFLMNSFNNPGPFGFHSHNFEGCGAEIPNPEALVEHFNTQHRPALENLLAHGNNPYSLSSLPPLQSSRTLSSSPSNALERSHSSTTHSPQQGAFPPTPLSLCHDASDPSKSSGHLSRSSTVSQPGTGEWEQQQCLWCNPMTGQRCGQIFPNSEELFLHVNGQHIQKLDKGASGFLCHWENCKRRGDGKEGFPQRSKIERHMHTHIGRKPFECRTCGQRFSAQQALTQHQLIHSDEKPLTCDWEGCGKTFRQQSALTMHRRCHTGEKPLKCPVCGKAFSESSNLSKHKRIHETKGRFSCKEPGCNKNFHRLDQLRRHMKLHPGAMTGDKALMMMAEGDVEVEDLMGGGGFPPLPTPNNLDDGEDQEDSKEEPAKKRRKELVGLA